MATTLTLVNLANVKAPDGSLMPIIDALAEDNEFLLDAIHQEANDTFSHVFSRQIANPTGSWRQLNKGVAVEVGNTRRIVEGMGMLESYSEPDRKLVDAAPDPKGFRMQQAFSHLQGMSQNWADTFIYGNVATDPDQFTGLQPRMQKVAATKNVIDEGGSSASHNTSIYGVQWGVTRAYMIYPKGSQIGLLHEDLGRVTVSSAVGSNKNSTAQYEAYRDHFVLETGFSVGNSKSIIRLANIATSGTTNLFDEDNIIELANRMPMSGAGTSLYVNATIKTQMQIALKDKNNVNYTADSGEGLVGVPVMRMNGMLVRKLDAIITTEPVITT